MTFDLSLSEIDFGFTCCMPFVHVSIGFGFLDMVVESGLDTDRSTPFSRHCRDHDV